MFLGGGRDRRGFQIRGETTIENGKTDFVLDSDSSLWNVKKTTTKLYNCTNGVIQTQI